MKLLLKRDQRPAAIMGAPTFTLDVRAEITPEERTAIDKYKLGKTFLYVRNKDVPDVSQGGFGALAAALKYRLTNLTISVDDLTGGKRIACKDILEMLGAEEQIKEAAQTFKAVLQAAIGFGGEEVVALT